MGYHGRKEMWRERVGKRGNVPRWDEAGPRGNACQARCWRREVGSEKELASATSRLEGPKGMEPWQSAWMGSEKETSR